MPAEPASSTNARKAPALTAKPGGTGTPAASSSPRFALLPPNAVGVGSPQLGERAGEGGAHAASVEDRDDAGRAVDADRLPGLDLGRRAAGPDDGGQPVLAADDRGVRHDAADVGDDGLDVGEDRRPGRRRDRADEDVPVAHAGDLLDVDHDPRDALDGARRRRGAR